MIIKRQGATEERRELLKEWSMEQFKKYGLFSTIFLYVVYWESVATKKEIADGVAVGGEHGYSAYTYNAYNYLKGEHYYLKNRIYPVNYKNITDELRDLIGEEFILFEVRSGLKKADKLI